MMTEGLANELWSRDIDVNTLVPGPTATATFDNASPGQERTPEEILAQDMSALPKGLPAWERVKHPDEVADFAFYLATRPVGGPTGKFILWPAVPCRHFMEKSGIFPDIIEIPK